MPDWLLNRSTVIALAIIGGLISLVASLCRSRGILSEQQITWLNKSAYAFMGVSMILFIVAGFFGEKQ